MGEKKQINIQVGEERKEKWERHAESNMEAANLSHLIRTAVEKEIEAGEGLSSNQQQSQDNSEVVQAISRLEGTIEDIDDRLGAVERAVKRPMEQTALANEVFAVLPPVEPGTEQWEESELKDNSASRNAQLIKGGDLVIWKSTASNIANWLEEDVNDVKKAIQQLLEDTRQVRVTEHNDKRMYYKKE